MGFFGSFFGTKKTQSIQTPAVGGLQVQTSAYGKSVAFGYGTNRVPPNLIWYGNFQSHANSSGGQSGGGKGGVGGGGGGKGGGGSASYTYTTSFQMGIGEGPIVGVRNCYIDKNIYSLADLGLTLFTGTYPQDPWDYLVTSFPAEALGYNGIAHVDAANYALGNSPNLPNHNFEVQWGPFVGSTDDADASRVMNDLLTNPKYGSIFPASNVGSLVTYQNYVLAAGLLVSPLYSDQKQVGQMLDDLAHMTNSEVVFSSGIFTVVPYGDTSLTGNGHTYTPPAAPQYDLTDDDFLPNQSATGSSGSSTSDPVLMTRKDGSTVFNSLVLEYSDRANLYNPGIVTYKDQASIDTYGLKQDGTRDGHVFADGNAAKISITLQGQRESGIRNGYQFTVDQRFIGLDPMDIVSLTDSSLNLNRQWVRILEITENDDWSLSMVAEDYLDGVASAPLYSFSEAQGFSVDYNSSPGDVNVPVIFEAPVQIAPTGLEVWAAVSGGANWGGCDVWISTDGNTYKLAGRINGESRQGVLTHSLGTGSDPDLSNVLQVSLAESFGELLSGTQDDADSFSTLCYVDGEFISYQTATLTGSYAYDLTYLRRGAYGSTNTAHANGTQFARLDGAIFTYPYNSGLIGTTIYMKFVSFNIYGGGQQNLADVTPYSRVLVGPPIPADVQGFGGNQNGNSVVFFWDEIADYALKGYDIGYAPQGTTNWDLFQMLTEAAKGTEMTNAAVPPGSWTFGIRARDIVNNLSTNAATFDLIVENQNATTTVQEQFPDFPGTLNNLIRHWTGVVVPDSTTLANATSDYTIFDNFVVNPVASCYYITPNYDIGYVASLRIFESNHLTEGPGQSGTPVSQTYLDAWSSGPDPGVYVPWTIGGTSFRYCNMKITYSPVAGAVAFIDEFSFTIDQAPLVETSPATTVIIAGGTTVTFPTPFHIVPFVNPVVVGNTALYASVETPTLIDCKIHVWDHTGTDVGGVVTWTATGE